MPYEAKTLLPCSVLVPVVRTGVITATSETMLDHGRIAPSSIQVCIPGLLTSTRGMKLDDSAPPHLSHLAVQPAVRRHPMQKACRLNVHAKMPDPEPRTMGIVRHLRAWPHWRHHGRRSSASRVHGTSTRGGVHSNGDSSDLRFSDASEAPRHGPCCA